MFIIFQAFKVSVREQLCWVTATVPPTRLTQLAQSSMFSGIHDLVSLVAEALLFSGAFPWATHVTAKWKVWSGVSVSIFYQSSHHHRTLGKVIVCNDEPDLSFDATELQNMRFMNIIVNVIKQLSTKVMLPTIFQIWITWQLSMTLWLHLFNWSKWIILLFLYCSLACWFALMQDDSSTA